MSSAEQIFIKPDLDFEHTSEMVLGIGELLAYHLDLNIEHSEDESVRLSNIDFAGIEGLLRSELSSNVFANVPGKSDGEAQAYDDYPLVWRIVTDEPRVQADVARRLFEIVSGKFEWHLLLVHDVQIAVAAWDPVRKLREFPDGTSVFAVDRHVWGSVSY